MPCRPSLQPYWTEARRHMEAQWSQIPLGVDGSALINTGRLVELFSLLHNPYHTLAFGGLSIPDCMLVCARMLVEKHEFVQAARVFDAVERIEVRRARTGHVEPPRRQPPPPSPDPLPDANIWTPPIPEPSQEEIYFDTLPVGKQIELEADAIARARKRKEAAAALSKIPFT